eukprot:2073589-Amphidinium_carterae.1
MHKTSLRDQVIRWDSPTTSITDNTRIRGISDGTCANYFETTVLRDKQNASTTEQLPPSHRKTSDATSSLLVLGGATSKQPHGNGAIGNFA